MNTPQKPMPAPGSETECPVYARLAEVRRLLEILDMTIERRIWADQGIKDAITNVHCELILLESAIKRKLGER